MLNVHMCHRCGWLDDEVIEKSKVRRAIKKVFVDCAARDDLLKMLGL